ncbi:MAG: hypothetical protein ACOZCO_13725 [Bacteroidota bacterium]
MLTRILLRSQRFLQLIVAFFGSVLGAFVLLFSVQLYFDMNESLLAKEDALGSDYLVIQKKVAMTDMLGMEAPAFYEDEIEEIAAQEFVEDVGAFEPSLFEAKAVMAKSDNFPHLNLDLYFEAVPDNFIDVKSEKWKWKEGDELVPVILPSYYLDAYNFGFAPGRNLPPIPEKMATSMKLVLEIEHKKEDYTFPCKVIGLSDRINSLLVPLDFLRFANENFRNREPKAPSRLIVAVDDITNPKLSLFMQENDYDTNQENLKGSRIKTIMNILLTVFLIMGIIIIILSALGFIQYNQIMISNVNYEIRVLILLGYKYLYLSWKYIAYLLLMLLLVLLCAWMGMMYGKSMFDTFISEYQFTPSKSWSPYTFTVALLFFAGMLLANSISIILHVRRLAKEL